MTERVRASDRVNASEREKERVRSVALKENGSKFAPGDGQISLHRSCCTTLNLVSARAAEPQIGGVGAEPPTGGKREHVRE